MSNYRGLAALVACAIAFPCIVHAQRAVGTLRVGGSEDATRQVREWHDASHRSCAFVRVVDKVPLPAEEDQASAEKWVVEACRGAQYDYRVVRFINGGVMVADLHETSVAQVPGTQGEAQVSADAPPDVVTDLVGPVETQAQAYIAQARATWPAAKARYLAGLPAGHIFFVTMRLYEGTRFEQVFVRVDGIEGDTLHGRIASPIEALSNHRLGDPIDVPERDVLDWTIARPDGTEEGNYVGKFLDTLHGAR